MMCSTQLNFEVAYFKGCTYPFELWAVGTWSRAKNNIRATEGCILHAGEQTTNTESADDRSAKLFSQRACCTYYFARSQQGANKFPFSRNLCRFGPRQKHSCACVSFESPSRKRGWRKLCIVLFVSAKLAIFSAANVNFNRTYLASQF